MAMVHDSQGNYDEASRVDDQAKIRMKRYGPITSTPVQLWTTWQVHKPRQLRRGVSGCTTRRRSG